MKQTETKNICSFLCPAVRLTLAAAVVLLLARAEPARADDEGHHRAPTVPPNLVVPAGNQVHFHALGVGAQIYTCQQTGTDPVTLLPIYGWVFKAPAAVLYDAEGDVVGIHYAGPTWESESGSKVVGLKLAASTVDPNAIPWLLLQAVSAEGHGIFARVTYIQRVNTVGGKAPTTGCDATTVGMEARVPYMADYYFYRAEERED